MSECGRGWIVRRMMRYVVNTVYMVAGGMLYVESREGEGWEVSQGVLVGSGGSY